MLIPDYITEPLRTKYWDCNIAITAYCCLSVLRVGLLHFRSYHFGLQDQRNLVNASSPHVSLCFWWEWLNKPVMAGYLTVFCQTLRFCVFVRISIWPCFVRFQIISGCASSCQGSLSKQLRA